MAPPAAATSAKASLRLVIKRLRGVPDLPVPEMAPPAAATSAKASLHGVIKRLGGDVPDLPVPEMAQPAAAAAPRQPNHLLDYWAKILVIYCSASSIDMALLSAQINSHLPAIFCFLGLTIILAFTCLFVGKFIRCNFEQAAEVLERFGIFFGVTAIFISITIPFPLWFKCVTGFIYVLCWSAILACNLIG